MDEGKITRTLLHLADCPAQGQVWLAESGSTALGYAIVIWFWSNEYGGVIAVVDEIWVEAPARGRGVGSGLLRALQHSRDDLVGVDLEVSPENAQARAWYERRGFRPIRNQMLRWRPNGTELDSASVGSLR